MVPTTIDELGDVDTSTTAPTDQQALVWHAALSLWVPATLGAWHSGSGAPANTLGVDGDFYVDDVAWEIYGPKAAGAWPAGVAMIPGSSSSAPTIRATTPPVSSSASSYTLTFPTGTVAGDVVLLFAGHGFQLNTPTGWTRLDKEEGSSWNGGVFAKEMVAADITTGSVTITTSGVFNGVFCLATIVGSTMSNLRDLRAVWNSSGVTSWTLTGPTAKSTDLVLAWESTRLATNCTWGTGVTSLQALNATSASGSLGQYTATISKLGAQIVGNFAGSGSGYHGCILVLQGS